MIFCGPIQPGKKPVGGLYLQFELVLGLQCSVDPDVGLKPPDILSEA